MEHDKFSRKHGGLMRIDVDDFHMILTYVDYPEVNGRSCCEL
jgi:hypothetical protein